MGKKGSEVPSFPARSAPSAHVFGPRRSQSPSADRNISAGPPLFSKTSWIQTPGPGARHPPSMTRSPSRPPCEVRVGAITAPLLIPVFFTVFRQCSFFSYCNQRVGGRLAFLYFFLRVISVVIFGGLFFHFPSRGGGTQSPWILSPPDPDCGSLRRR